MLALGIGLAVIGGVILLVFVVFLVAPDRVKDFFGTTAMWFRSLATSKAESKGRKHKRRTDPPAAPEHMHRRNTPRPSMLMTIRGWAQPPRSSDQRRRSDDTPEDPGQ